MFIHEALLCADKNRPFIRRKSWARFSPEPFGGIKLQPTNSPDGLIIESDVDKKSRRSWQPTAADLMADDWETVL